ncbi:MAG TPA: GNAT family N-acetyltransferase [Nitrosopumilus sp.]|jgi:RimJ/RimL family protein N-acetyltransferase|nr:GNAT family N-acetyltransferase [Nitrosopumilus sp.]
MNIQLETVTKNDWDYILKLRNSRYVKSQMYTKHKITKLEHYAYLKKQQRNKNFVNWIIHLDFKNIGYIRILDNDVSIMIEKKYHGMGIGTIALTILEKEAKKLGIKKLVGRVMVDNEKSQKIFLKNKYKLKMYWYEKKL